MIDGRGHRSSTGHEVLPRIERADTFEELAGEWADLCRAANSGIFATWDWADAWWRAFGETHELALHAVRGADGELVAVLPLYVQRRAALNLIRFVGHGPGDELGPLHRARERTLAAAALRLALAGMSWDVAALEQLPGGVGWPELLDGSVWRREANPVLRVGDGGWDGFIESRSANFRQQLRRREREALGAGTRFRATDTATLEADLDTLFRLHRARWDGLDSDFGDAPFHRDVARRAMARGWLRLWLAERDGEPSAAWYGFHVGTVTTYYQAGRDPAVERQGIGTVLLAHTIRHAMAEGATEYRFGRGAEPFKYRFTDDDPGLDTVVSAASIAGRAAVGMARVARRARRLVRRGP